MSKKIIADVLLEVADAIETGNFSKKPKIGLTMLGSEHGTENMLKGAELAKSPQYDIVLIGPKSDSGFETVEISDEEQMYSKMEELLDSGYIDACVTMHYNFPIGVSTVGRVVTPGFGKEMILATTTGTSATDRVEAMIKNTISGIATAKSIGIENPKVGLLNLEGIRQVEKALVELKNSGYEFEFGNSLRADGGAVMRGNDLLTGTPDVMVTDTLTGNLLMKVFSSFNTGGSYEATGYGYGPGVGRDYGRKILIVSRASGAPVIANAIRYGADIVNGNITEKTNAEFEKAEKAGLGKIIEGLSMKKSSSSDGEVICPQKEIVTNQISGIDILDLEDAAKALWKEKIYAETGMGCTGPIILVSESNFETAFKILVKEGYVTE